MSTKHLNPVVVPMIAAVSSTLSPHHTLQTVTASIALSVMMQSDDIVIVMHSPLHASPECVPHYD